MSLYHQVLLDAPLIYWAFDEAVDSTTCLDRSGNGRNGTKQNTGASLGAPGVVPGLPYSETNIGVGYWSRADEAAFQVGTGNFTYECWMISTNPTSNYVQVFSRDTGASGNGQLLYLNNGDGFGRVYCAGVAFNGTTRLSDGALHHVAVRRISGVASLVVDGVQQNSAAAAGSVLASELRVNTANGGYQYFQGRMAHFAYYASGLSDARISAHYQAGLRSGVVY